MFGRRAWRSSTQEHRSDTHRGLSLSFNLSWLWW
jgi:hypothetical protein